MSTGVLKPKPLATFHPAVNICCWHKHSPSIDKVPAVTSVTSRWQRPVEHYDWLVDYLRTRGMDRIARFAIAICTLAITAWPVLMLFSSLGPIDPSVRTMTIAVTPVGVIFACWWMTAWLSLRQSKIFVLAATAAIMSNCILYDNHSVESTGATAFGLLASYTACAHTRRYLAVVLTAAITSLTMYGMYRAQAGDLAGAAADCLIRLVAVTVVPLAMQLLVQVLVRGAVDSDTDPLTTLPNRRGFDRAVGHLIKTAMRRRRTPIPVTIIDIDDFKFINDTHGHAIGDQVLLNIGLILRRTCPGNAAIARIGGEEFVIASLENQSGAVLLAEQLRAEFAATPWDVSASFGVATITLSRNSAAAIDSLTDYLIRAADEQMYSAKRAGGSRVESVHLAHQAS